MNKNLTLFLAEVLVYAQCVGFVSCGENVPPPKSDPEIDYPTDLSVYDNYYIVDGIKIELKPFTNRYYLLFPTEDKTVVVEALQENGIDVDTDLIFDYTFNHGMRPIPQWLSESSFTEIKTTKPLSRESLPKSVYLSPFYILPNGYEIGPTNIFSVRPEGKNGMAKFEKLAEHYNCTILGINRFDTSIYYLTCSTKSSGNALQISNLMHEFGGFEYTAPEFIGESHPI
jgi:hypothetical protein